MGKKTITREEGFSLIDIVFTLFLFIILFSIAIPSYKSFIVEIRLLKMVDKLTSTINYARSEAISRQMPVIICPSHNKKTCGGTWRNGWIVTLGYYKDNLLVNNLLRIYSPLKKYEFLIWRGAAKRNHIKLNFDGSAFGYNGSFIVCVKVLNKRTIWSVKLSGTGKVSIDKNMTSYRDCYRLENIIE